MPNQLLADVEQRIVAFALGAPGLGPRRIARELARPEWGGIVVSAQRRLKALRRHGLNTRAKRLALVAGYRAPYEPPREPAPEPHIDATGRASWSASTASTSAAARHQRRGLADHRDRHLLSLRLGRARRLPQQRPDRRADLRARAPRRRATPPPAGSSSACSRQRQRVPPPRLRRQLAELGARHSRIRAGRPQTNGHVERLHRTILEECWRPAFARYLHTRYTGLQTRAGHLPRTTTTTTASTTDDSPPGDPRRSRPGARGARRRR